MTLDQSALLELTAALRSADGGTMMRTMLATMLQALIDAEATEKIGAGRYERSEDRTTLAQRHPATRRSPRRAGTSR